MNEIAVFTGNITIYWSAVVITLGIAAGLCLSLALYPMDHRHNTAVWVFFPIALALSVLPWSFGRRVVRKGRWSG